MSTTNLFSDFNKVSAKEWKQKIQMDLKGADYNKTLLTNTLEGITIQPFYHQETFKSLEIPKQENQTKICQTIFINDEKIVNNIAKEVLQKGAESIRFIANEPFRIKQVFKDLPKDIDYLVICNFYEEKFIQKLISISKDINLHIIIDSIHHFVSDGNWFSSQDIDFDILHNNPTITIGINASLYQNAGANIVQQIAYSLAHVNEYLNFKKNKTKDFIFTFAIGSNYFFEISKIRAFKYLIKKLLTEYNSDSNVKIILEPTLRNKTLYDYNVNLLRTTTESMAAMLSGADYITNVSYDSIYHRSNEFGSRIARNQLLVLKEESYFNKENDLSKGSYYIEQITFEIADKALALFKDIENNGGFLVQLEKETIQRKIEESAKKEQALFDNGELILLGTNKHPNPNDKMKEELKLYPFVKTKPRKTKIKPIISRRLSEKLEQERLKEEKL
jgi:methylmalonyl-CoA mutase